jgi:hypothetical protein
VERAVALFVKDVVGLGETFPVGRLKGKKNKILELISLNSFY